ncbi:hypothetical protein M3Y97_00079000 [Aphelenchoides bicaudatus]|nr:hypothetical protein M3Y97_00079000 [Aphelenchoides bicaudatus]
MRFCINSVLAATTLPFLFCLISDVNASRHRHQQHQSENSVSSTLDSKSSSNEELTHSVRSDKSRAKQKRAEEQLDNFGSMLPNTSPNRKPDLMRDYLSRNMYACSANYVETLSKLHALIKTAYEEYQSCQQQLRNSKKTYSKTSFEALDQLLAEWKDEDDDSSEEDSIEVDTLRPASN